jgi:hypothetical protein
MKQCQLLVCVAVLACILGVMWTIKRATVQSAIERRPCGLCGVVLPLDDMPYCYGFSKKTGNVWVCDDCRSEVEDQVVVANISQSN